MLLFYNSALVIDRRILAQHAIHQWNHKQRGEGSQQQAADHGAAQRRVLFAAFAHAERHRQHAHDGGGGHEDGTDAGVSGGKRGGACVHSFLPLIVGEHYHQDAVGGGHADTHDGAHQGGYAEGGLRNEQHPDDAGQCARQGHQDDERVQPALEIHRHQQVDQHHGKDHAEAEAVERGLHGEELSAHVDGGAAGQLGRHLRDDLFDARAHAAQIAAVHIGIHIHHRLDVVVVDDGGRHAAADGNHIGKQLGSTRGRAGIAVGGGVLVWSGAHSGVGGRGGGGRRGRRGGVRAGEGRAHRRAQHRVQRIQPVLRGLHGDAVAHTAAPVEELRGRDLSAGTQGNQQAGGHVALRQAQLSGLAAVHVDIDGGVIHHLVNVDVGRAGNARHFFRDLTSQLIIDGGIAAYHLNIDRGRQSEIQDLVGDVGGFEEEDHVGKLRVEALAQSGGVIGGGAVLFGSERNQDVAVGDAERRAVSEGEIETAGGDADVVDDVLDFLGRHHLADFVFDGGEDLLGFFDAGAGGRARVETHGAGIHRRKEIASDQRRKAQGAGDKQEEAAQHRQAVIHAPAQQRTVGRPHQLEAPVEDIMRAPDQTRAAFRVLAECVDLDLGAEHVVHHGGDQGARKKIRCQHGENHGHGKRCEQVPGGARQQQHGHEQDADGERGDESGSGNLLCAVENGAHQRLTHGHIAMRVLDFHGGVVHQDADGQRQAAQRHHVRSLAQQVEENQRSQNGERNRDADNDSTAPASQEEQDHHAGEHRRDGSLAHHAVDGRPHEQRLVEELPHLESGRQAGHDFGQQGFDVIDYRQGGRLAVSHHRQQRAARTVGAHDAGLHRIAVPDLRHVFEVDRGAIDHAQWHEVQFFHESRAGIDLNLIVLVADLGGSGPEDEVLIAQGGRDVGGGQSLGGHLYGVEIDHDLTVLAAIGRRHRRTLNRGELGADEILPQVEQILLA